MFKVGKMCFGNVASRVINDKWYDDRKLNAKDEANRDKPFL